MNLLTAFALAVIYFAVAKAGLALAIEAPQISAVWPATGLAIAAALRVGRVALPAVFIGAFAANATQAGPLWVAAGIASGNTLEAWVAAAILTRLADRLRGKSQPGALVVAAAIAPIFSASIGVSFLIAGGLYPFNAFADLWRVWWLGDALGAVVVAPLLLTWHNWTQGRYRTMAPELLVLLGSAAILCSATFMQLPNAAFSEYIVFPFIIWAAIRFGPAPTALVVFVCDAIAVAATYFGHGPFAGIGPEAGLVRLQMFAGIAAVTGWLVASMADQQRQAEEGARARAQELETMMDAVPAGVWIAHDPQCQKITGNRYGAELLAMKPNTNLSKSAADGGTGHFRVYQAGREIKAEDLPMQRAAREGVEIYGMDEELRFSDGSKRHLYGNAIPLRAADGSTRGAVGAFLDVTHQKTTEEALRESDRRKDEFLAILAHELRNPLAPLSNGLKILKLAQNDPAKIEQARTIMERQLAHVVRLIDDLLDVSRITRGKIDLQKQRVDAMVVLSGALEMIKPQIENKRLEIIICPPPEPLFMEADPVRLTQIIGNLLDNACKFTDSSGTIKVAVAREDGYAVIRVQDNGIGIEQANFVRMFEIFGQLDTSTERKHGGLGIGLALVKHLTELHGGTVAVHSDGLGHGAEFVLRLPSSS